jgi:hypothetical protein
MPADYGHGGASRRTDPPTTVSAEGSVESRRGGEMAAESKHVTEAAKALAEGTLAWAAPTGTSSRATFDTAGVTTAQLAQRVKALIDDLTKLGILSK